MQVVPNLTMSRSHTSRPARPGEQSGVDYNFIAANTSRRWRQAAFLEWADVFGHYYGTSKADTDALLSEGRDVVLVIDVQGARQVRSRGIPNVGVPTASFRRHSRAAASRAQQGLRIRSAGGCRSHAAKSTSIRSRLRCDQ